MSSQPAGSGEPSRPAASPPTSPLEQVTAAYAAAVGTRTAWLERVGDGGVKEVVAAVGPSAPRLGRLPAAAPGTPPETERLALRLEDRQLGALVAAGAGSATPEPASGPALEAIALAGALALQNAELVHELEHTAAAATERHYRLIRGAAHHLRDVLGVASEYTQLLDMESALTPRQQEYIRASRRNIETAVRLITELLDLGRVDSGRVPVEWGPVDVRAVVRGMVRDYQRTHAARQLVLETRLEEPIPTIHSDLDVLRRVLDTLLSNAFKYAPERTAITVVATVRSGRRAADPRNWICVTIADQGPGVAEREDVFEELSRLEVSAGPGFRLAISRRLARLLGGDLTLDTPSGPGASFTLWLPTPGTIGDTPAV